MVDQELPLMKTVADAIALAREKKDPFYLTAFMLQAWLGALVVQAAAEYAEKKNPLDRSLQTGQAWRAFQDTFASVLPGPRAKDLPPDSALRRLSERPLSLGHLLGHIYRFVDCRGDTLAGILHQAVIPVGIEHEVFGDFLGPKTMAIARDPVRGPELARATLARWCDWLDAVIHYLTHRHWHLEPACFDPDPDQRELASLGVNQRNLADLSDPAKAHWQWHFAEAAERFKSSPKWPVLGLGLADPADRLWLYADTDLRAISLWPLLKRHNWTYADLLHVIQSLHAQPANNSAVHTPNSAVRAPHSALNYPLDREQTFSTYCNNVLGLRKSAPGTTAKDGLPKGHQVAELLFPKKP
jgi:hypothetical protein